MTYFLLFIILLLLLIITYFIFGRDISSPSFITALVYLISLFFAIIGLFSWNNQSVLSFKIILIIIIGIISFIAGEFLSRITTKEISKVAHKVIEIDSIKNLITIFFLITTMILLILNIKGICNYYGFDTWNIPKMLSFYRLKTQLFSTSLNNSNVDISFFVKQMQKVSIVIGYIYIYIYINNYFCDKSNKKNRLKLILPIIISSLTMLLYNGGRSSFMHLFVAIVLATILILREKYNCEELKIKAIKIVFTSSIMGIILLFALLPLVGRDYNSINKIDYTSFVLGANIPSFNSYISTIHNSKPFLGYDTFSSVYYVLDRFNIVSYDIPLTHVWTSYGGGLASNTYTGMWDYYSDFGMLGVIFFEFIIGYIVYKVYCRFFKGNKILDIFSMIFMYTIIDQIRDEQFVSLINTSTIAIILIIIGLNYFYFRLGGIHEKNTANL